jgi:hypothetical protein
VGWHEDPLDYPPHHSLTWAGRFDDPRVGIASSSKFRTLYLARRRRTAFAETLQDLRPATKDRADFRSLFGTEPPAGVIARQWRHDRRLGRARLDVDPALIVDLEDLPVRRALEEQHAALLAAHGMRHLDISQVRSAQRIVTQTIALDLHGSGYAGVAYRSNLDNQECVAIFEQRVVIRRWGSHQRIERDDADLVAVAKAWKLDVR